MGPEKQQALKPIVRCTKKKSNHKCGFFAQIKTQKVQIFTESL